MMKLTHCGQKMNTGKELTEFWGERLTLNIPKAREFKLGVKEEEITRFYLTFYGEH